MSHLRKSLATSPAAATLASGRGARRSRAARWVVLACVLAAPLAAPTDARAADDKTMPGSACVASSGNNPGGTKFVLENSTLFYADSGGPCGWTARS
jgi:hypothetical protein